MKLFFSLALFFTSVMAHSRLEFSELDPLILDSELILDATPIKIEPHRTTFKVLKSIKGNYTDPEIVLTFKNERHEQRITNIDSDRLLFLKRDTDGAFTGTKYGRSYWAFTTYTKDPKQNILDDKDRYFAYLHPISMVKLTAKQKKELMDKDHINMGRLKSYISGVKAEAAAK